MGFLNLLIELGQSPFPGTSENKDLKVKAWCVGSLVKKENVAELTRTIIYARKIGYDCYF
jgi:hypothetical protein